MDDYEQRSLLGSLLAPLTLPGRAAKDLEAIGTAARGRGPLARARDAITGADGERAE